MVSSQLDLPGVRQCPTTLWSRVQVRGVPGRITCFSGGRVLVWFGGRGRQRREEWLGSHEVTSREPQREGS